MPISGSFEDRSQELLYFICKLLKKIKIYIGLLDITFTKFWGKKDPIWGSDTNEFIWGTENFLPKFVYVTGNLQNTIFFKMPRQIIE